MSRKISGRRFGCCGCPGRKNEKERRKHTYDRYFISAAVYPAVLFRALLVVLQGARIYEKTAAGLEENYTVRTAVSYLQEKVRECGDSSKITVKEMSGRQVLVIEADVNGESYASYIYQEDGYLKELFTKKETFSGLQGGQELVALDTFSSEQTRRRPAAV